MSINTNNINDGDLNKSKNTYLSNLEERFSEEISSVLSSDNWYSSDNFSVLFEQIWSLCWISKEEISKLLSDNYWKNNDSDIYDVFWNISKIMSFRNEEVWKLTENFWIDFHKNLDFTWWNKISIDETSTIGDPDIKEFLLNSFYTRNDWNTIYSRWYWYYFNLPWYQLWDAEKIDFKPYDFFESLQTYINQIDILIEKFKWRSVESFSSSEIKAFKIILEHKKNILFFLTNTLTNIKSSKVFAESISMKDQQYKKYYKDSDKNPYEVNSDFFEMIPDLLNLINKQISETVSLFNDINFWINLDQEVDLETSWELIDDYLNWNLAYFFNHLNEMSQLTDNPWEEKNMKKLQNKISMSLIRIIREQDDPAKMLLSGANLLSSLDTQDLEKDITILWVLYGWIEYPFHLKYLMDRLSLSDWDVNIELTTVSNYNLRNKKEVSSMENYPNTWKSWKNYIILDDNIYNWWTLQSLSNFISQNDRVIAVNAVEAGIRRANISKLKEGSNLSFLLWKTWSSASVAPISKFSNKYETLTYRYIKNRMPDIVWKP